MQRTRQVFSVCVILPLLLFPFIIFPLGLRWGLLFSVSPSGYAWHWGKIHTRKRWSLLTAQPSQGWVTGLWKSLECLLLSLFEPCSPPGLYNSAPAWETGGNTYTSDPTWVLQTCKTCCRRPYLSKVNSGCFKAPNLQSLLEEIKGVCDCFTNHSSSTATDQALQVTLKIGHKRLHGFKLWLLRMCPCYNVQKYKLKLHWPPDFPVLGCEANSFLKTL